MQKTKQGFTRYSRDSIPAVGNAVTRHRIKMAYFRLEIITHSATNHVLEDVVFGNGNNSMSSLFEKRQDLYAYVHISLDAIRMEDPLAYPNAEKVLSDFENNADYDIRTAYTDSARWLAASLKAKPVPPRTEHTTNPGPSSTPKPRREKHIVTPSDGDYRSRPAREAEQRRQESTHFPPMSEHFGAGNQG